MDIRIPIGLLFTVLGLLISGWGLIGGESAKLPARLGENMTSINMNLWWGLVLLVFGALMLLLTRCCKHSD